MASGEYLFYENEKPVIQEISRSALPGGGGVQAEQS
jgi:hypothetical protein